MNGFASTLYNVAAGGTDFQDYYNQLEGDTAFDRSHYWNSSNGTGRSSAKSYVAETPWNDTCASSILSYYEESGNTDPNALCDDRLQFLSTGGGGGGVSIYQPRPSWQNGTVYGIPPTSTYNFRLLPDVSLFAANGLWTHALDYYQSDTGGLQQAGGTSFVAPQLAGVFALIAQKTGRTAGPAGLRALQHGRRGVRDYQLHGREAPATAAAKTAEPEATMESPRRLRQARAFFTTFRPATFRRHAVAGSPNCYTATGESYGILSTSTTSATGCLSRGARDSTWPPASDR